MEDKFYFTEEENRLFFSLYRKLLLLSGDALQKTDRRKLKQYFINGLSTGILPRNGFGMNPIIKNMQTAVIVADEIGMKRASILGIMLHELVKNKLCTLDDVQNDFGEDVAGIIRGLVPKVQR